MKRILVIGSSGSGKSTFARRLGELLSLEVIHLDRLFRSSGWIETPKNEWRTKVAKSLLKKQDLRCLTFGVSETMAYKRLSFHV
jgi:adenylate kinase family enzyme